MFAAQTTEYKHSFAASTKRSEKVRPIRHRDSIMFGNYSLSAAESSSEKQRRASPPPLWKQSTSGSSSLNFNFETNEKQSSQGNSKLKQNYFRAFDLNNKGFGDDYFANKGEVAVVRLKENSSSFGDKSGPFGSESMPAFSDNVVLASKPAKKRSSRNMFVSHIDSHMFPGK